MAVASFKNLKKMDEDELHEQAKKTHDVTNLEERVDAGHRIMLAYRQSPNVGHKYLERSLGIDSKSLDNFANELHKKFDEKAADGKFLNYNEQMDFFKKLANVVAPPMYIGSVDTPEENWKHLELYLEKLQSVTGEKEKTRMDDVKAALRQGDAHKAKQLIVDSVMDYNRLRDEKRFMNYLIPPDDSDLHLKLAGPLTKKLNKELEEAGIDKEYKEDLVATKIHDVYRERAKLTIDRMTKYKAVSK